MTIKPNTPDEMAALVQLPMGTKLKCTCRVEHELFGKGYEHDFYVNGLWDFLHSRYDVVKEPEPIEVQIVYQAPYVDGRAGTHMLFINPTERDAVLAALSNTVIEGRKVEVVK